jgi:hypothetical protein
MGDAFVAVGLMWSNAAQEAGGVAFAVPQFADLSAVLNTADAIAGCAEASVRDTEEAVLSCRPIADAAQLITGTRIHPTVRPTPIIGALAPVIDCVLHRMFDARDTLAVKRPHTASVGITFWTTGPNEDRTVSSGPEVVTVAAVLIIPTRVLHTFQAVCRVWPLTSITTLRARPDIDATVRPTAVGCSFTLGCRVVPGGPLVAKVTVRWAKPSASKLLHTDRVAWAVEHGTTLPTPEVVALTAVIVVLMRVLDALVAVTGVWSSTGLALQITSAVEV